MEKQYIFVLYTLKNMAKKIAYSEAVIELESIVARLQEGEVEIDQLRDLVARSSELLAVCKKILTEVDDDVRAIIGKE